MAVQTPSSPAAETQPTEPQPNNVQPTGTPDTAAQPGASTDARTEEPAPPVGWLQRLFRPSPGTDTERSAQGQDSEGSAAKADSQDAPQPPKAEADGPDDEVLTLTRKEMRQKVQSEKDRELARTAKRDTEVAGARKRVQQSEELRRLSDPVTGDPVELASKVREVLEEQDGQVAVLERQREVQTHVHALRDLYDEKVVDVFLGALPATDRDKLTNGIPENLLGVDQRSWLVTEGLKALKAHFKTEGVEQAKKELRKNEAFRKELISEIRSGRPEPDLIPAGGVPKSQENDPNTALRNFLRSPA